MFLKKMVMLSLLFLGLTAFADVTPIFNLDDPDATQLGKLLNNIQTMQADFVQQSLSSKGKVQQTSQGHMSLSRPGKFRWDTRTPSKQLLVTDGTYVWIYDPGLQQVVRRNLNASNAANPASLLSGKVEDLQQRFYVTKLNPVSGGGLWYELKPKQGNDLFQWIQLRFDNNDLSEMRVADNLGQESVFTFSNVKVNASLSAQLFQFTPPKGVDVVKD
jgi:outer membrane lipoprotein carrier protein